MKIFLIIIIFLCCVLIGINIKSYFIKRKTFYQNLNFFCENLFNEISFNNQKLSIIVRNNFYNFNEDFNTILLSFEDFLLNKISKKDFEKSLNKNLYYLNKTEIKSLLNFLYSIGSQTKEEEIDKIKKFIKHINIPIKEENEKTKKYSTLYFKLFIVLGLAIAIIFI
ncbi:MAG: hypothetical protein IJB10_05120 [Clostridia bacterium]|nr:hypothetical protein [Clostridia bacterium]